MHIPNPYTLPAFDFVGGSTQDLIFHCYFFKTKKPQDLSACVADFSIINFVNKNGKPLLSKQMEIRPDPNRDGDVNNVVCVTLEADETVNLRVSISTKLPSVIFLVKLKFPIMG